MPAVRTEEVFEFVPAEPRSPPLDYVMLRDSTSSPARFVIRKPARDALANWNLTRGELLAAQTAAFDALLTALRPQLDSVQGDTLCVAFLDGTEHVTPAIARPLTAIDQCPRTYDGPGIRIVDPSGNRQRPPPGHVDPFRWGRGFHGCAHWLSWRTGIAAGAAREKVLVARALESLPQLSDAIRHLGITPWTATPDWHGERLDLHWTMAVLRP